VSAASWVHKLEENPAAGFDEVLVLDVRQDGPREEET